MYMKVFPHGKGNGASPVNYLIRLDYLKRADAPPEVLRGDPALTTELIDSLDTKWKFTAGVLSWSSDDKVSSEQEQKMMNDFERLAFAGMQPEDYNILWVRHMHAEHHELHFVIPRVELSTGKAFNPCPPGWQKHFDVLRDLHNHKEGWARPDDPLRARLCTPDHADLHTARLIRWGKSPDKDERAEAKEAIHTYLKEKIEQGIVTERKEMLMILQDAGLEINRAGKDYITVKDTESGEKLRLKGGIYAEQWQFKASDYLGGENQNQDKTRSGGSRSPDQSTIDKLERELKEVITKRSEYNRNRYFESTKEFGAESEFQLPRVKTNVQHEIPTNHNDNMQYFDRGNLKFLGTHGISAEKNNELTSRTDSVERAAKRIRTNSRPIREQNLGIETDRKQRWTLHNIPTQSNPQNRLDFWQKSGNQTGVTDDRTRNLAQTLDNSMAERNTTRTDPAQKHLKSTEPDLDTKHTDNQNFTKQSGRVEQTIGKLKQHIQILRTTIDSLEQRFKQQKQQLAQRDVSKSHGIER